ADPHDAGRDHAGRHRRRRLGQPRGGRAGEVCGATTGSGRMTETVAAVPGRIDAPGGIDGADRVDAMGGIERAIADIAAGRPVIVVDDADRENEGDLIFAAELATPELVAFMVRHTSGYIGVPLRAEEGDRLALPPQHHTNQDKRGTAYAVTVDAREGVSTGISAADRARTMRLLAGADSSPRDFTRPGHVVPLRAKEGGVLRRAGRTEAAIDLPQLAGRRPARVLREL